MTLERHLAIFIPSLRGGGAERITGMLAGEFARRGVRTDLLLAKAHGPYLESIPSDVRVVDLHARRPALALGRLARHLRTEKPGALLSVLTHANLIAATARKLAFSNVRHVVVHQNDARIRPPFPKEAKELPNFWLLGPAYRQADKVVAVSEGVAESLIATHSIPPELIRVIYNPVLIPEPKPSQAAPHPWLAEDDVPVVIGAGALIDQKGFDSLIEAFHEIRSQMSARLVIIGEGPLRSSLERQLKRLNLSEHALMPGFVADPWNWIRRASVFVLSSRWEGLPGVLLEAMACGVPVVSTDCPSGPREILEGGKWGRLVPVDDSGALAEATIATLRAHDRPSVRRRAAEFNLEVAADHYLDALGILSNPPPRTFEN